MSGASTPEIESNLKQAYTEGTLDRTKIWTTFPLSSSIGIPPANHLAYLPIGADEAIRLYDDPQGNARWTSAHAMYANLSRYGAPVHPASRTLKETREKREKMVAGDGRLGRMVDEEGEQTEGSAAGEGIPTSPEVAESFDQGEETGREKSVGKEGEKTV